MIDFVAPMLAQAKDATEIWDDPEWSVEEKFDGARYLMYVTSEQNRFFSRRTGVNTNGAPVEKTDRLPHLANNKIKHEWYDTIIDGEILAPNKDFGSAMSVIGSLPQRALEIQQQNGFLIYQMFDILRCAGEDVTSLPLYARRLMLIEFAKSIELSTGNPSFKLTRSTVKNKLAIYKKIVSLGGEGVMLKYNYAPYAPGKRSPFWVKVKKQITVDAVIMGYEMGKGKFNQQVIGNIVFGGLKNGKLVKWGTAAGLTQELINEITANPDAYLLRVVEIECQEILPSGKVRHPRFLRFRPDKNAEDCVYGK